MTTMGLRLYSELEEMKTVYYLSEKVYDGEGFGARNRLLTSFVLPRRESNGREDVS